MTASYQLTLLFVRNAKHSGRTKGGERHCDGGGLGLMLKRTAERNEELGAGYRHSRKTAQLRIGVVSNGMPAGSAGSRV